MKINLYGILLLFMIACQSEIEKDGVTNPADSTQQDSLGVPIADIDFAIDFKGQQSTYFIAPLNKESYNSLKDLPLPKQDKIIDLKCEDSSEDCEKRIEKVNMEAFSKWVSRHGDSLLLKCGDNDSSFVSFVTKPSDEDDFATYSFVHKYDDPDIYLVSGTYWESFDYKIVSRKTCKVLDVIGIPTFSPDRKRAVITNEDLVAGFTFNGIEILLFQDTSLVKDASQEFSNWAIETASWISNDELKITQITANYSSEKANKESYTRYAILKIK